MVEDTGGAHKGKPSTYPQTAKETGRGTNQLKSVSAGGSLEGILQQLAVQATPLQVRPRGDGMRVTLQGHNISGIMPWLKSLQVIITDNATTAELIFH